MNHSFDVDEAKKYGVECAIIISNIRYWVAYNKANRKNIYDGRAWTYNSVRAYSELFPYWTADQIRRYFEKLEKCGAIITGNYNKRNGDRTKWHSVPGEESVCPVADSPEHLANSPDRFGEIATPLPDINTDVNADAAAACLPKPKYGNETKTKVKSKIDLSPIEPVLKILRETDKNADKSISLNLRNLIRNEIELNGEEYVGNAVRGRIAQAKATGKELWLTAFFDPDRAEWRATCARAGEAQQNAAQGLESGFKSTLPDFSHIKYDDAPIDEEAWQTLTGSKN